jgi:hypothetical protein
MHFFPSKRINRSLITNQTFVNLQPNPLYWADTLSQWPGMMVLIETPAFAFKGVPPPG